VTHAPAMIRTILVADASPTIRRVVELTLADDAFRIEMAADGHAALLSFERLPPDLVLVDVALRDPSGYEVCRRMKAANRTLPVLLLTGAFETFDEERARACGADAQLGKPFESAELVDAVTRLLEGALAPADEPVATVAEKEQDVAPEEPVDDDAGLERAAREAIERLAEQVLRRVAEEIVPQVAERVVRERIRELEQEDIDA